jgi:hypothetical protein
MDQEQKLDRRQVLKAAAATGLGLTLGPAIAGQGGASAPAQRGKSVAGYAAPKMDRVRVGFIGVGARGSGHVAQMLLLDGVDITAICDTHKPSLDKSVQRCVDKGRKAPAAYGSSPTDYRRLVERDDVDIVIISTPWEDHVPMAVAAMKAGKHAFIEVPAATTVEGCWELVDTAEETQRHCMMLENVNYGRDELMVLNMCRQGVFGELLHGEAAYIHDLRWQMKEIDHGTGSWRTYEYTKRNGNLYPTHGLGPVAQYMNINRGDRLDFLCSVSSPARCREIYAREHFPEGHERRSLDFICGDINTSIVKTVLGKTILIQWDEQLPRPYTRLNLIQGTRGIFAGFPNRCTFESHGDIEGTGSTEKWVQGQQMASLYERFDHPLWKRIANDPANQGGHGGMDFIMLWRIVYCLRNGLPLDQDVYDAAVWSVIGPLSEESVANRGRSVDVPDFTRGQWRTMPPLEIVS